MLAVNIDNPEIENRFKQYAKKQKKSLEDVVSEAMKYFLEMHKKDDALVYVKKDPMKHLRELKYEDDGENLDDVKLYSHVEDSASYVHNLRKERA